jgi:hypothetical protein
MAASFHDQFGSGFGTAQEEMHRHPLLPAKRRSVIRLRKIRSKNTTVKNPVTKWHTGRQTIRRAEAPMPISRNGYRDFAAARP